MIIRTLAAASLLAALPALASAQLQPPADHGPATQPRRPGACADPEYRQFDFWIGWWSVAPTGAGQRVAASRIERLYDGCAIRENWIPVGQPGGGSLSSYVKAEHVWKQTWVDGSGARAEFKGGWNGRSMVLTGPWPMPDGRPRIVRMTYTPSDDGSVRQAGEQSFDDGHTWRPSFDFTYTKAPMPVPPVLHERR